MRVDPFERECSPSHDKHSGVREAPAGVDSAAFRHAMRDLAAGVAIVACGSGAERVGCTVTSLTSLSLAPPALLVSLSRSSSTLARLKDKATFGVSLLAARHERLANRFAGLDGISGGRRFEGESWTTLVTGAPLLSEAIAAFDCSLEELIERHTHAIVIGAVLAVRVGRRAHALARWRGGFTRLA
jgi:flavin reductase (DIM6/NTAB) family NADH-FMN oxidoreductase RutF